MLGKLMKYEMSAVGRIVLPLYAVWILLAGIFGFTLTGGGETITGVPQVILGILYGVATATALILTFVMLVIRFYRNLLGNEGYLMFSLPVTTGKHMCCKTLSSSIWLMIASVVGLASAFLIAGLASDWAILKDFPEIRELLSPEGGRLAIIVIELLAMIFLGCAGSMLQIYAAIALGHQWGNHRVLGAVLAYAGFSVIEGIVINFIVRAGAQLGNLIPESFTRLMETIGDFAATQVVIAGIIVALIIYAAVYWLITWLFLRHRLNLQ